MITSPRPPEVPARSDGLTLRMVRWTGEPRGAIPLTAITNRGRLAVSQPGTTGVGAGRAWEGQGSPPFRLLGLPTGTQTGAALPPAPSEPRQGGGAPCPRGSLRAWQDQTPRLAPTPPPAQGSPGQRPTALCSRTSLGVSSPQSPRDGKPARRGWSLFSLGTRVAPAPASPGT